MNKIFLSVVNHKNAFYFRSMNHVMTAEEKQCLECGRELFGRADKKFCSDACRSAYNNKASGNSDKYIRKVNRKLKRNRSILELLNPEGKTKTHKERLLREGFDFDYFTNTYITKDQKEYRFCYDQGYLMLGNDFILLVRRDTPAP